MICNLRYIPELRDTGLCGFKLVIKEEQTKGCVS